MLETQKQKHVLPVKTPWNQSILFEELLPKSSGEAILSLRGRSSSTETGLPHFSQRATGKDRKIERSELTVPPGKCPRKEARCFAGHESATAAGSAEVAATAAV